MMPLLDLDSIRAIERAASEHGVDLMARAGLAIAEWIAARHHEDAPILAVAGRGNNGGDALVAGALLLARGYRVDALLPMGEPGSMEAIAALHTFRAAGGNVLSSWDQAHGYALALDGLFGIGLCRPLQDSARRTVERLNDLACPILALDCPSGLDAWTGQPKPVAVRAAATLSFICPKPGLYTGDGRDYCGDIRIASLGLPEAWTPTWPANSGELNQPEQQRLPMLARRHNSHKGSYGSVAVVGGANGMAGAALLAARAALLMGAGKVFAGFLGEAPPLDGHYPELMLRDAASLLDEAGLTVLAVGPGLGQGASAALALAHALERQLPCVLDADALNLLAADANLAERVRQHPAPCVLTPHPGEAARLLNSRIADSQADRVASARLLAERFQAVVVLKGAGSLIARPGGHYRLNPTGHAGMAAAGQGDTLTGLIAGLLAQGAPAFDAAALAVWLAGRGAERLARRGVGPIGLTASETAQAARAEFNRWLRQD